MFQDWAKRKAQKDTNNNAKSNKANAVIQQIQKEAKANGATLDSGGKGGLDPKLALEVFRRGKWKCSNKHCPNPKTDLTLDHIAGHPKEIHADKTGKNRKDLKKGVALGHVDKPDALHVLCAKCHQNVHNRENEIDAGKKPEPMRGT